MGSKKVKISFEVKGRPPRKLRDRSLWSSDEEAPLVKKLREKALEARNKKIDDCFHGKIKLNLSIYTNKILDKSGIHDYVGDLDSFVSGVCESLHPANIEALNYLHSVFKNNVKIYPDKPILFDDDSQVIDINAKKSSSKESYYVISIEGSKNIRIRKNN